MQQLDLEPGRLRLQLEVHALEEAFPACIGWHPWFRRQLRGGRRGRLEFEAGAMYVRGDDGIPTGELREPGPGPYDDCFRRVRTPIRMVWPEAVTLELRSSASCWVMFDELEDAICVEPQTGPPNALNDEPFVVAPGQPLTAEFEFSWTEHEGD